MERAAPSAGSSLGAGTVLVLTLVGYPIVAMVADVLALPNRETSIAYRSALLVVALGTIYRGRAQLMRVSWRSYAVFAIVFWAIYLPRMAVYLLDNGWSPRLPRTEYFTWAVGVALIPALACGTATQLRATMPRALIERTFCPRSYEQRRQVEQPFCPSW